VLSGLLLSAGENHGADGAALTLSCFDYEVSARVRVAAEVAEPGTVLVPGRLLLEIVRSLPPHPVQVSDDTDGVWLSCGDAAFQLTPLPLADYPALPDLPNLAGTADGGVLAAAIGQVTPAASRDDTLPLLTAVNVELAGETMTLAATDRYRLAVRDLPWQPGPGGGAGRTALLVPARTLADAARMMAGGTEVRVLLSRTGPPGGGEGGDGPGAEGMIGFEAGGRRLTVRLLAGEFVRYRSRFPDEFGCTAELPAGAFAEAVRRVALVAERGTPVQLSFAPGRVTVGAATAGQARARETVSAEFTGDEPAIAFSPQYLLDGVLAAAVPDGGGAADETTRVRLSFTSSAKPAVVSAAEGGGFRYLVVPQRLR
jgi:DNA polymerase III subunit beta